MKKPPQKPAIISFFYAYKTHLFLLILLIVLFAILYKLFIPRISAFGCFDDCFNIVGGYFITKGKTLYSEVFFNHQMLMAYISAGIQLFTKPENIYELILVHRQFLLIFGFFLSALLIIRFGSYAFATIAFYELTKFYLFGNRFLAESFIVYPLMYMLGLVWYKFSNRKLYVIDYVFGAIFTWFVIWMREPYIPLATGLFTLLLTSKTGKRIRTVSLLLFIIFTAIILFFTPLKEYFYNVITVNQQTVLLSESQEQHPLLWITKIFFYPLFSFTGGEWNHFRYILIGLSIAFLSLFFYITIVKKHYRLALLLLLTLGFANFRPVQQGHIYYSAFHMIVWYGLFLFSIALMLQKTVFYSRKIAALLAGALIILFGFAVLSPDSYTYEKAYPHEELITNYGKELQAGEGLIKLSLPNDTVFLDGFDDLIYWQADRMTPYKYSWYTSIMPAIPVYRDARITMFRHNPPDFYYGSCPKELFASRLLPAEVKNDYIRVYQENKPSCLFIHKNKMSKITETQWKSAAEFGYHLAEASNE